MASVHDVAAYILDRQGEMTAWKLQKLVYYSQAWNLVWNDGPIFDEEIEAWANGPVVRELYDRHRGQFIVREWEGDPNQLDASEASTVESILDFYGEETGQWLSELTHLESPWKDAREGLPPGARSNVVISHGRMADYYGQISS